MKVDVYKRELLRLQTTLLARERRDAVDAQAQVSDTPGDAGDAAVTNEAISKDFSDAQLDADVLTQIGDALQRIENGTYGRCLVDGEPIEEGRLDAVPWAAYCIKHQRQLEGASRPKPTL